MEKKVELEIAPDGSILTIYRDGSVPQLAEALGARIEEVRRASLVEWENGGWVVRAAHDPELAIRWTGLSTVGVVRTGDLCIYKTREEALEDEVKHFWELMPPKENSK